MSYGVVEGWYDGQPCFICNRDIPRGSTGQKVFDDDGNERLAHNYHQVEDYRHRCPKCRAVMPNHTDDELDPAWVDEPLCERCVEFREIAKTTSVGIETRMLDGRRE